MKNISSVIVSLCLLILSIKTVNAELLTFNIGNSLTGNLVSNNRLAELAVSGGQEPWTVGYHIRSNSPLLSFITTPDLVTDMHVPYGAYTNAFASTQFDAVILQPFYGGTIQQEVDAAKQLIGLLRQNPANANARVLIYATWSANNGVAPFQLTWNRQDFTLESPFEPAAQSYELLMQALRIDVPNIELIPVGHVFNAVMNQANSPAGVPGLNSVNQLIGDGIHSTNAGGYLAGITAYSVLYGKSPLGLEYTPGYMVPLEGTTFLPAAVPVVQQIAWDVVTSIPEPSGLMTLAFAFCVQFSWMRTSRRSRAG